MIRKFLLKPSSFAKFVCANTHLQLSSVRFSSFKINVKNSKQEVKPSKPLEHAKITESGRITRIFQATEWVPVAKPLKPIIALDVGNKFVGVAISDSLNKRSEALATIGRTPTNTASIAKQLKETILTNNVQAIVVGIPAFDQESTAKILSFAQQLCNQIGLDIPIVAQDESRTTLEVVSEAVQRTDIQQHKYVRSLSQSDKKIVDALCAAKILQRVLDKMKEHKQEQLLAAQQTPENFVKKFAQAAKKNVKERAKTEPSQPKEKPNQQRVFSFDTTMRKIASYAEKSGDVVEVAKQRMRQAQSERQQAVKQAAHLQKTKTEDIVQKTKAAKPAKQEVAVTKPKTSSNVNETAETKPRKKSASKAVEEESPLTTQTRSKRKPAEKAVEPVTPTTPKRRKEVIPAVEKETTSATPAKPSRRKKEAVTEEVAEQKISPKKTSIPKAQTEKSTKVIKSEEKKPASPRKKTETPAPKQSATRKKRTDPFKIFDKLI